MFVEEIDDAWDDGDEEVTPIYVSVRSAQGTAIAPLESILCALEPPRVPDVATLSGGPNDAHPDHEDLIWEREELEEQ
jgi:hypothetical protein